MNLAPVFEEYARRYMAGDAGWVAELYDAPFIAVRDGQAIHLGDRASVEAHVAELMAGYRHSGAARADIAALDVLEQGDGAALVTVHWQVRADDERLIRDFRTSYQVVARPTVRVVSYVNHDTLPAT